MLDILDLEHLAGITDFDLAASQPVSVIMDGVVQENVILKSFPLFDIAQMEVSRGPQGTLFGRNSPAGVMKAISFFSSLCGFVAKKSDTTT